MVKFLHTYYVKPLSRVMLDPSTFFKELHEEDKKSYRNAIGFVVVSSVLSALLGALISGKINPLVMYAIFFANAFGMVLISMGMGYILMRIIAGKTRKGIPFCSVYAFSCGTTLLFSWIPYSAWIIEPWKWWLIGTGLANGCGLPLRQAVLIILFSISIMIILFWFLLKFI